MRIGEEVRVRGVVDEIRKDTVIIKNRGGYFGTVPEEIEGIEQEITSCTTCKHFAGAGQTGVICESPNLTIPGVAGRSQAYVIGRKAEDLEYCKYLEPREEDDGDEVRAWMPKPLRAMPDEKGRSRILRAVGRYIQTQAEENGLKALGVNGYVYGVEDVLQELDAVIREEEGEEREE